MNFIISVPSNVTLSSKSPYLTAHTKINYETGCIGRFLKKHRDVSWTTATARMELFEESVRSFHILTNFFFFLSGFSSQTLTIHGTAREGRGPSFIPLYHFHPLTNIETFICNFAFEMTITPDCYSMRFTTLSNYHLSD